MTDRLAVSAALRAPADKHHISQLPKPIRKDAEKGKCKECGGWHGLPAVHLDYMGHAAVTDRLLDADPTWTWEPLAFGDDGLPRFDGFGGMWIRLTVGGVTRLGYGDAQGKPASSTAVKEIIGDAIRNAAMRFGVGLELWHKGDLHDEPTEAEPLALAEPIPPAPVDPEKLHRSRKPVRITPTMETQPATDAQVDEVAALYSRATGAGIDVAGLPDPRTLTRAQAAQALTGGVAALLAETWTDTQPPTDRPGPEAYSAAGATAQADGRQMREIGIGFTKLGITDRVARLEWARLAVGLDALASSKDLTHGQARDVLLAIARELEDR